MIPPLYQSWYYARPSLAAYYLDLLRDGPGDPIALVGDRRIGKTLFLRTDLLPEARNRGFLPIYVDLWQLRQEPLEAINFSLQDALDDLQVPGGKLKRRLATTVKKIGLAGGHLILATSLLRSARPTRRCWWTGF